MSKLVSPEGEILVPGVKDLIAPVTKDEQDKFEKIHFQMQDIHGAVGGDQTLTNDTVKTVSQGVEEGLDRGGQGWKPHLTRGALDCFRARTPD